MFSFLKDKLKSALSVFSKKVDEKGEPAEVLKVEEHKTEEKIEEKKSDKKEGKKQEKKEEKKKELQKNVQRKKEFKKKKEGKKEEKKEEKKQIAEKEPEKKEVEKVKKEIVEEKIIVEQTPEEKPVEEEKGFFAKLKEKFVSQKEKVKPEINAEAKEEAKKEEKEEIKITKEIKKEEEHNKEKIVEEKQVEELAEIVGEESKGWFGAIKEKITTKKISSEQFDELFWDLELAFLENNVAVEVIEKIKNDLRSALVGRPLPRSKIEEAVTGALRDSVSALFDFPCFNLVNEAKKHKPFVICLAGVNGSGKTTTIAKLVSLLQKNGLSCVIAAADTFRAAAIDQLQLHADVLNVKLIKHDYGADAAAVAFDAIKHAEAKNKDVVLIDTAGRLHSNVNLMDEMKKIFRVAKPNLKLFIGESITGNDCVEQARLFDEAIGIDGIILSKADIDEKGGAALSVSYVTKKPILYFGTGQNYGDLELFDKEKMMKRLGL